MAAAVADSAAAAAASQQAAPAAPSAATVPFAGAANSAAAAAAGATADSKFDDAREEKGMFLHQQVLLERDIKESVCWVIDCSLQLARSPSMRLVKTILAMLKGIKTPTFGCF